MKKYVIMNNQKITRLLAALSQQHRAPRRLTTRNAHSPCISVRVSISAPRWHAASAAALAASARKTWQRSKASRQARSLRARNTRLSMHQTILRRCRCLRMLRCRAAATRERASPSAKTWLRQQRRCWRAAALNQHQRQSEIAWRHEK